jgi:hypothetical protein
LVWLPWEPMLRLSRVGVCKDGFVSQPVVRSGQACGDQAVSSIPCVSHLSCTSLGVEGSRSLRECVSLAAYAISVSEKSILVFHSQICLHLR